MIKIEPADRLKQLPACLCAELDLIKEAACARGVDVIDPGVVRSGQSAFGNFCGAPGRGCFRPAKNGC